MPCFDQWFDSFATDGMPLPAAQESAAGALPHEPDADWQPL